MRAFEHNIIALIWDFDKTLAKNYMQKPIFKEYNINEEEFWKENNSLVNKYKEMGITVNKDTIYLNHFLTCVNQGIFPGLNNSKLRELGKEIEFFDGLPDFFNTIKNTIEKDEKYKRYKITVEHYIVSTGLKAMIEGSKIAPYVKDIWGCTFIENPIPSKLNSKNLSDKRQNNDKVITQIGYAIDHTSKTRAVFEINKGINVYKDEIDVNDRMPYGYRRIPFSNMIYIADGPSDVPVFSLLKQKGGKTFAVYPKGETKSFNQVDQLREDGRIDMYGEADYTEESLTYMWLVENVKQIADKIYNAKEEAIKQSASQSPKHIL